MDPLLIFIIVGTIIAIVLIVITHNDRGGHGSFGARFV